MQSENNNRYNKFDIMLIDDSRIDNFIHQKLLENNMFCSKLDMFRKAKKALEHLRSIDPTQDHKIPHLIFLDIKMPQMNGFEFLDRFSHLAAAIQEKTRVVILSSYGVKANDLEALRAKHPCIISSIDKPLIPKDLDSIGKALKRNRELKLRVSA